MCTSPATGAALPLGNAARPPRRQSLATADPGHSAERNRRTPVGVDRRAGPEACPFVDSCYWLADSGCAVSGDSIVLVCATAKPTAESGCDCRKGQGKECREGAVLDAPQDVGRIDVRL